jgi:MOSC domain-containing protein
VKSLGLVHPDEIELERNGVRGNRRFWLVDSDGRLFNNKRNGPMVRIRPSWDEDSRVLTLEFPDGSRVEDRVELGDAVAAEMYRHPHPSRRVLGPWEQAVSDFVGRPLTLLYADDHAVDRGYCGGTVSLVSLASLDRLRIEGGRAEPVDGRRFRMLLEIDGVAAHAEDDWLGTQVRVGEATIVLNGDVGRCVVTTHDPDTGVTDFDTLKTLAAYRPEGRNEPLPIGVYGAVVVPGRVRVGDAVEPLQERLLAAT